MLIGKVGDIGHTAQILAYELSQDAVALTMEDAHTGHTHKDGIVDEILHGIERLIATHTPYVEVLVEIGLVLVYRVACLGTDAIRAQVLLALFCLVGLGGGDSMFQTVEAHLGTHTSKDSSSHIARYALYGSYGGEPLDAYGVAY